jgi:hypothetical protein
MAWCDPQAPDNNLIQSSFHQCQNRRRHLEELREAMYILNFGKMWVMCGQMANYVTTDLPAGTRDIV